MTSYPRTAPRRDCPFLTGRCRTSTGSVARSGPWSEHSATAWCHCGTGRHRPSGGKGAVGLAGTDRSSEPSMSSTSSIAAVLEPPGASMFLPLPDGRYVAMSGFN